MKFSKGMEPYFIADIGANHDGDLNRALSLIELAKTSGADAAKFQNFHASTIVSNFGFENMGSKVSHQKGWKRSVYEIYEQASISQDWTRLLKEKCDDVGIEYFTSAYDKNSVDHVNPYVSMYKIGSGDITWIEMVEYIASKKKTILIATGASTMEDVHRVMASLKRYESEIILMQCNTNYTGGNENFKFINLNVLPAYNIAYPDVILGLSDHTPGHSTVLGALALGARVFEKHFTDDNDRDGPDHRFAMNPKSWKEMVKASRELFEALGDGKKVVEANEELTSLVQRRALRYSKDLKAGMIITEADIFPLRPFENEALHPFEMYKVLGQTLNRPVRSEGVVLLSDLEND